MNDISDTVGLVVHQVATGVVIEDGPLLVVGASDTLVAVTYDSAGAPIGDRVPVWTSSHPDRVSVDGDGVITVLTDGEAIISAAVGSAIGRRSVTGLERGFTLGDSFADACIITTYGSVYCGLAKLRPMGLDNTAMLAEGGGSYCVVSQGGTVSCLGQNRKGQLGVGDTQNHDTPVLLADRSAYSDVDVVGPVSGDVAHSCGVRFVDQKGLCWGSTWEGQLGFPPDGVGVVSSPTEVETDLRFRDMEVGHSRSCGLTTDNEVHCWGDNQGLGSSSVPILVVDSPRLDMITAGSRHTCGRTSEGAAFCWGANNSRLGNGGSESSTTAVPVAGGHVFEAIDAGVNHTCGINTNGELFCWGYNDNGELGDGTTQSAFVPVLAAGGVRFRDVIAGWSFTVAITANDDVWLWGGPVSNDTSEPGYTKRILVKGVP